MRILNILTLLIIGTIPILFAAVEPWVWSVYGLMMIFAFLLHLWTTNAVHVDPRFSGSALLVLLFFTWSLVLCLPFPFSWIAWFSPVRAELLSQARALCDITPIWETFSYLPQASLTWWIFLLSLGLFHVVVSALGTQRRIRHRIVMVMIGLGLVESVYGVIQALVPSMGVLWVDYVQSYMGTARGTFINRNNFAGFIEMIWPLALGVTLAMTGRVSSLKEALNSDKLNRQALMALGIIVLLMALIFTRSRGGIISGVVGFATFTILARREMKAMAKQTRLLLGGIVVLLIVYMAMIGIEPIVQRFLSVRGGAISRMDIWRDSLIVVKDHPIGIGLGNYETVFAIYNKSATSNKTVVFAHNDYLQLLIETGWIGFIALTGAFFLFLWKSVRRIRRIDSQRDPLTFYLAVGAFSGLISMAVHGLFDFNLQIPANCLYFVVLMAILSACTQQQPAFGSSEKNRMSRRRRSNAEKRGGFHGLLNREKRNTTLVSNFTRRQSERGMISN